MAESAGASARAPGPPGQRGARRSHAERRAETRGRIIDAVLESVAEVGFQRTTAQEIAGRAGVTWGAVQHHFGGKHGMLEAVLEASFASFEAPLAAIPAPPLRGPGPRSAGSTEAQAALAERAGHFVDRAWHHFGSPTYRSTFEILLNTQGQEAGEAAPAWQASMFRAWDRVWMRIFRDAPIPRRRHRMLQHYTIATLSGLASMLRLEGPRARLRPEELGMLKDTLIRELTGSGAGNRAGSA